MCLVLSFPVIQHSQSFFHLVLDAVCVHLWMGDFCFVKLERKDSSYTDLCFSVMARETAGFSAIYCRSSQSIVWKDLYETGGCRNNDAWQVKHLICSGFHCLKELLGSSDRAVNLFLLNANYKNVSECQAFSRGSATAGCLSRSTTCSQHRWHYLQNWKSVNFEMDWAAAIYVSVAVWKLLISQVTVSPSVAVGKSCSPGGLSLLELRPVGFPDRKQRTRTCLDCIPISLCKLIYSRCTAFSDLFLPYRT